MVTMTNPTKVAQVTKVTMIPKINNHTSLYDPTASGGIVDPTLRVSFSAILLLLIVEN
jgi:hypothetical protein